MIANPAATPVTMPPVEIVAFAVLLLLQTPPVAVEVKREVAVSQSVSAPDRTPAAGNGLTVIVTVALADPQLLATV
jgi:hypothetical protein